MTREEWLLLLAIGLVGVVLYFAILNYHGSREQRALDRLLIRELRRHRGADPDIPLEDLGI